jgi:hypothetical protein
MMRSTAVREGCLSVWNRAVKLHCPNCEAGPGELCRKGNLAFYARTIIHSERFHLAEIGQRLFEARKRAA